MKTWKEYLETVGTTNPQNVPNRPNATLNDRSLESFPSLISNLSMAAKGVLNPMIKQEINTAVSKFRTEMDTIFTKYQGQGFSPNYQPNPNPWSGQVH